MENDFNSFDRSLSIYIQLLSGKRKENFKEKKRHQNSQKTVIRTIKKEGKDPDFHI